MDYQKDIKIDTQNKRTESDVPDLNSLNSKSFLDFTTKKTEKLVMALYMVTDGLDMDEALKNKLRSLAVELMSDIHNLSSLYKTQKNLSILSTQNKISEILSFIEVSKTIGFVSEMNSNILKKEFEILLNELVKFEETNQNNSLKRDPNAKNISERFLLDKESLFVAIPSYEKVQQLPERIRQDIYKGQIKDRFNNNVFYDKNRVSSYIKDTKSMHMSRGDRRKQILDFIKDKNFISIKDISISIKDCSEKTIQRELNEMVNNGQIIKEGEKRWSRYKYKDQN